MQGKQLVEFFKSTTTKHCPECGEGMKVHSLDHLMECDRCLSKRPE
ncbi:protein YhfH [Peribacillus asahii]|nr:protein YhfH [Peribacillus asahii]USK60113.1 YhfH family protein [Peribacillus asahii]